MSLKTLANSPHRSLVLIEFETNQFFFRVVNSFCLVGPTLTSEGNID